MRTLAIGDIHGCLTALERLLAEVCPQADDLVVTLGDYVDRGPDSKGVIERLLKLANETRLVCLRGNHDFMMQEVRRASRAAEQGGRLADRALLPSMGRSDEERDWLLCGGRETLASYAPPGRAGTLEDVPEPHWGFLEETCRDWFETDTHFFVHANAYPDRPLDEQPSSMLHWEKLIAAKPHVSGKTMICGHTAQRSGRPRNFGCAVCIDTWVYGQGWLTCLDTESGQYWQANQRGETRTSLIGLAHW